MHRTTLRRVGGSVMLAVPPACLETLALAPGRKVDVTVDGDRLVVVSAGRPRYRLDDLLAEEAAAQRGMSDAEWLDTPPEGRELI